MGITSDNITDLKILLESSNDSLDFIEQINCENRAQQCDIIDIKLPPNFIKNNDNTYDVDGNVVITGQFVKNGELIIKFKHVTGSFWCSFNDLTTIKGVPEKVDGDFYCSFNKLASLKYAPSIVGGSFHCCNNKSGKKFTEEYIRKISIVKGMIFT